MATTTKSPSISFFSSSIFGPSSLQNTKFAPTFRSNSSLKPLRPLSVWSNLTPLPVLSFTGEKVYETHLNLKSAPLNTARAKQPLHSPVALSPEEKQPLHSPEALSQKKNSLCTPQKPYPQKKNSLCTPQKPYPQKKTGRASRGSQRTSLRPGNGVVFGHKPKDWSIKINWKEKRLVISTTKSSPKAGCFMQK